MRCTNCGRELHEQAGTFDTADIVAIDTGHQQICKPCARLYAMETETILSNTLHSLDELRQACFYKFGLEEWEGELDDEYGKG